MFMKKVLMLLATVILAASLPSCQKVVTHETPDSVALYTHPGSIPEAYTAGTRAVTITATCAWTAASEADWITVSPTSGERGIHEVILTYTENTSGNSRSGGVKFSVASGYSETYVLTQAPFLAN